MLSIAATRFNILHLKYIYTVFRWQHSCKGDARTFISLDDVR